MLHVSTEGPQLIVDIRGVLPEEGCPGRQISVLLEDVPPGTLCEIHVSEAKVLAVKAKLERMGHRVTMAEPEPGHYRLRMLKM